MTDFLREVRLARHTPFGRRFETLRWKQAQLDFIRRAEVVHFLAPPRPGKSHLATTLGVAAA